VAVQVVQLVDEGAVYGKLPGRGDQLLPQEVELELACPQLPAAAEVLDDDGVFDIHVSLCHAVIVVEGQVEHVLPRGIDDVALELQLGPADLEAVAIVLAVGSVVLEARRVAHLDLAADPQQPVAVGAAQEEALVPAGRHAVLEQVRPRVGIGQHVLDQGPDLVGPLLGQPVVSMLGLQPGDGRPELGHLGPEGLDDLAVLLVLARCRRRQARAHPDHYHRSALH
jgi:hypothetical protein